MKQRKNKLLLALWFIIIAFNGYSQIPKSYIIKKSPCEPCATGTTYNCDSVKNCVNYVPNSDSTYWVFGNDTIYTQNSTPIITAQPITGNGTIATPIALNANNDLGVQGGILQQGFPLVRDTKTNLSTFDREYFGGGIFSINNSAGGNLVQNRGKLEVIQTTTEVNGSLNNLYSLKNHTHNNLNNIEINNALIYTNYIGNVSNSTVPYKNNLYTHYNISGIAPSPAIGHYNIVTQGTGLPASFDALYGIRNRVNLRNSASSNDVWSHINENYYINVVNGYSYYSQLFSLSSNVTNYYSYSDRTLDAASLVATNYWSLYMSTNRDNYLRGKTKIGNGANKATTGYYLEVGGNSLFNGNVDYTGSLNFTSDRKLKNITSDYNTDFNKFKQIKTYNYKWKNIPLNEELDKTENQIGIIADEIEVLFPDFVTKNNRNVVVGYETVIEQEEQPDGEGSISVDVEKQKPIVEVQEVKSVNYSKLTIAMLSTIKQLIERVEILENKIK